MRPRAVRRVHGSRERQTHQFVSHPRDHERRRRGHDDRRSRRRRRPARPSTGLHRSRRLPVRLLHAGSDLFGRRPDRRGSRADARRNPRADERQHLPVRRLSEYRGRDRTGARSERERQTLMHGFSYARAADVHDAVREIAAVEGAKFIAGGTNLIDLMKENVERPRRLIDITHLPLAEIRALDGGGLRLGALVTNSDVAYDAGVMRRYPLLSKAILAGASAQLRNMASVGGNLMQRTRCYYFYDAATSCNKREPGAGCAAIDGFNRIHAILGWSDQCIATHPSDMCVALAALEATVRVAGPDGERAIPLAEFHRLPGDTPHIDTNIRSDETITAVDLHAGESACARQLRRSAAPRDKPTLGAQLFAKMAIHALVIHNAIVRVPSLIDLQRDGASWLFPRLHRRNDEKQH